MDRREVIIETLNQIGREQSADEALIRDHILGDVVLEEWEVELMSSHHADLESMRVELQEELDAIPEPPVVLHPLDELISWLWERRFELAEDLRTLAWSMSHFPSWEELKELREEAAELRKKVDECDQLIDKTQLDRRAVK